MRCNLVLRAATIVDGTGSPRTRGEMAVRGDCIMGVGNCSIRPSPVLMKSGPIPPPDLLGDDSWFVFDNPPLPAEGVAATWVGGKSAYIYGKDAPSAHAGRLVSRQAAVS